MQNSTKAWDKRTLISLHWFHHLNSVKPIKQSHTYIHTHIDIHTAKRNPQLILDQFSDCQGGFERRDPAWLILQCRSCNFPSYHGDRLHVSWIPSYQYIKSAPTSQEENLYYSKLMKKCLKKQKWYGFIEWIFWVWGDWDESAKRYC